MSNVTSPRCSLSPELVGASIAVDPGVQWLLCETAAARRETARDGGANGRTRRHLKFLGFLFGEEIGY